MNHSIELKRGTSIKRSDLKEAYVFNQSDPIYVKDKTYISSDHIVSATPKNDPMLGASIVLKLTNEGMMLFNAVAGDEELPMLVLFVNGSPYIVYRKIHKIERAEAVMTVHDLDFAEMIKALL